MNLFAKARRAIFDESGAVTVDWVVLTAAVVILSIGAIASLSGGVDGLIGDIGDQLSNGGSLMSSDAWTGGASGT